MILRIDYSFDLPAERVAAEWRKSSWQATADVQRQIDVAWSAAMQVPGRSLFNGPMCRLESFWVSDNGVCIGMSRTSYKTFWGTNLSHPELADLHGPSVLANPIGVSPALETADGWLLMGRRNERVAYYPGRIHPFAGCLEPADANAGTDAPNLFTAVKRELAEELRLTSSDIQLVRLTGLAYDVQLRQPELIFRVKTTHPRRTIESQIDAAEHDGVVAVRALAVDVAAAVDDGIAQQTFTPVAAASLLLWGRSRFGHAWYAATASRAGVELSQQP